MKLRVFNDAAELSTALVGRLREAFRQGPRYAVMLAGGRTPLTAYDQLAAGGGVGPDPAIAFLSDERHVPPSSPESNQGIIRPRLVAAGLPQDRFVWMATESSLEEAATRFDRELDGFLNRGISIGLGLLGLGADGHTASLFTLGDVIRARQSGRWAVSVSRPSPPDRISTTPQLFERIDELVFVVTGGDKAEIVVRFMQSPNELPAGAATSHHPHVAIWLDRAAASKL